LARLHQLGRIFPIFAASERGKPLILQRGGFGKRL